MMKMDMNVFQVLKLLVLAFLTVWLIVIPIIRLVGNILIQLLTCVVKYLYLSPMLAMFHILLEYDTVTVEKVNKEVKDEIVDRNAEVKKTKLCKPCCCNSHSCHAKTALYINTELVKKFFPNLMARPWWEQLQDYKAELSDNVAVFQDKYVFLPTITNMDQKEDVVENENASADTFMVEIPCSVRPRQIFKVSVF